MTLPGTETAALLLLTEITAAFDVAVFNEIVHVLDAPLLSVVGEQTRPINWTGATRLKVTAFALPLDPAVTVADWLALTCAAMAVKLAEVSPAPIVTLEGSVRFPLLLESGTEYPPANAADDKETVHDVLPGVFTAVIAQLNPLNVGWVITDTVTVPETPLAGIELPAAVAATTPVI